MQSCPPSLKGKLGVPNDVHEVALLSRTPLAGTGRNGLSQNIPRGDITKNPNDSSSPPLSLAPPSLFPPPLGNGGDLDAYIRDPASRQPTKKSFSGIHASLVTAALLTSSSASPARISIYTNKKSALASPAKAGGVSIHKGAETVSRRPLCAPMGDVMKEAEHGYAAFDRSLDHQDLLRESNRVAWRLSMDPIDQLINKEEKVHAAKVTARASCIELC